jgi:molybdopterin converting factor small subunit
MPALCVPSLMRDLVDGQEWVIVDGETVGQALDALEGLYPGVQARLCADGRLTPGLAVWVDNRVGRLGLREPVSAESEIRFLPAIAGG